MPIHKRFLVLTLAYAALLLAVVLAADQGALPVAALLADVPAGDKLGHFVLMGGLSFLAAVSLGLRYRRSTAVVRAAFLVALLVGIEEGSQLWLAHRSFEPADLLADAAGILVFAGLASLYLARSEREVPATLRRFLNRSED